MNSMKKSIVLVLAGLILTGCSSTKKEVEPDSEAFAHRMIADKVALAANAQHDYVAILAEGMIVLTRKQAALDTDQVDVDFIGKPRELLQTFAYRYGYKFVETGKSRTLKTVNVRVTRMSPIEVLRNIGYQINNAADVELDRNTKTLRLIYKK